MKRFLKLLFKWFVFVLLLACVLDMVFTHVYSHSAPRNKTQYILSLNEKDTLDYVFLGSSRVENTVVTKLIEKETGKKALNLGVQGAKLKDIYLLLKLLDNSKASISRIFIQVDYIYNIEGGSDLVMSQSLPYIRSNEVIKEYLKINDSSFNSNFYVPFYRYATNDYRIGFREFFTSVINKKAKQDFTDGFQPLSGTMSARGKYELPKKINEKNGYFEAIDSYCKKNQINVTYFTAPFCQDAVAQPYMELLRTKVEGLKDFSKVVPRNDYFKNCGHLNEQGAIFFTKRLIKELYL